MDPVETFPPAIIESIFLHLKGNDEMKNCTLVTRTWNNFVGSSPRCMDKWRLCLQSQSASEIKSIAGKRRYRSVFIIGSEWFNQVQEEIYEMMKSNCFWTEVNFDGVKFPSTSSFTNLVNTFEASVKRITFNNVNVSHHDEPGTSFGFKKLKYLRSANSHDNACQNAFKNCTSLDIFFFIITWAYRFRAKTPFHLEIAQRQTKLKTFKIFTQGYIEKFTPENFIYSFELEELYLSYPLEFDDNKAFVLKMLKKQCKIKKLTLNFMTIDLNILIAAFAIKSLKVLVLTSIRILEDFPWLSNDRIETLDMRRFIWNEDLSSDNKFIKSLPGVKQLMLRQCDEVMAQFLAENLTQLENLAAVEIDIELIQPILPNVKLFVLDSAFPFEIIR